MSWTPSVAIALVVVAAEHVTSAQFDPAPWLEAGERALVAVVASPAQRGGGVRTGPA